MDLIASGPTVLDTSTPDGCLLLFSQLGIRNNIPETVTQFLTEKAENNTYEQNQDSSLWDNVQNIIIGSNTWACESAAAKCKDLGYHPIIISTELEGEAKIVGKAFAHLAIYLFTFLSNSASSDTNSTSNYLNSIKAKLARFSCFNLNLVDKLLKTISTLDGRNKNVAIIAGSETTVNVKGCGKGGRNQEMALAAAIELHNKFTKNPSLVNAADRPTHVMSSLHNENPEESFSDLKVLESGREKWSGFSRRSLMSIVFLAGGTDGQDGPTTAAGGVISPDFVHHSSLAGFNAQYYLDDNDSYTLLNSVLDGQYLLNTGLTGTNVMDINLLLIRDHSL